MPARIPLQRTVDHAAWCLDHRAHERYEGCVRRIEHVGHVVILLIEAPGGRYAKLSTGNFAELDDLSLGRLADTLTELGAL
jgi:hypothetical protein